MDNSEMKKQQIVKLKVEELKKMLAARELLTTGNKAELEARLKEAMMNDDVINDDQENEVSNNEDKDDDAYEACINSLSILDLKCKLRQLGFSTKGGMSELRRRLKNVLEDDKSSDYVDSDDDNTTIGKSHMSGAKPRQGSIINERSITELQQVEKELSQTPESRLRGTVLTFRDIEETLTTFSGDDDQNVQRWIHEFEETAELCDWSDIHKAIYARRLLRGSAKLFMSFEEGKSSWRTMKGALIYEFSPRIDSHAIHMKLQRRKKKNDETYHEYCYRMMEIGAQINMETSAIIRYIIDGVGGDDVHKVVLYGAQNIRDLKERLDIFEQMKGKTKVGKSVSEAPKDDKVRDNKTINKRCFNCGTKNHAGKDCPDKHKGPKCFRCNEFGHKSSDCVKSKQNCSMILSDPCKYYKTVFINNIKLNAMIDTGSDLSIVRADVHKKLGTLKNESKVTKFRGIGSDVNHFTSGSTKIKMIIDNDIFDTTLHIVSEDLIKNDLLIGADFLKKVHMECKGDVVNITRLTNGFIKNGLNHIDCVSEVNRIDLAHVSENEVREAVENMIFQYEPNTTKNVNMDVNIILKDNVPIYQRARRLAESEKETVNLQIKEWLYAGIIRPSNSDYASPVVLVKKKDGSTRICIDYRQLNKKIVKNRYPLPIIDDQLSRLSNARIYSTLDLENGFFHVPINEQSRKFTGFVIPNGHYEFCRLPFGLCISPAYFQKFINIIFRDLSAQGIVIIYLDDLIIPAKDLLESVERLKLVLNVASDYGLRIKWAKCNLLRQRVTYLGYVIENGTITPSVEKTRAVQNFPIPRNVTAVQSFLGLTGFFRKFVPKYSLIARPLTNLTKENVKFHFDEEQRKAFEELKAVLCDEPVLKLYRPDAITDRGSAFTSGEFNQYCKDEGIEHVTIVTGVPRGNGQIERVNRTVIPLLTKLSSPNPENWYKHTDKVQQYVNHVPNKSTHVTPFSILFGTRMRLKEDPQISEILEKDQLRIFSDERNEIRRQAKGFIERAQKENKRLYDRKRKAASTYKEGDLVVIKRTQCGPGTKLCNKFLGPYEVTQVLRNDRYLVKKISQSEGPRVTSTSVDFMKKWVNDQAENENIWGQMLIVRTAECSNEIRNKINVNI